MFNINNFDEVNISYGSNAGDIILEETANRISEILKGDKIYRVGSDEFIVYSKRTNSTMDYNKLINDINTLRFQLTKPYDIETGKVTVSYSTSMVKKAGPATLTSRTLEYLKDAMNRGRIQNPAEISYVDMDMQSLL
jgi:Amt family ammonium transporter